MHRVSARRGARQHRELVAQITQFLRLSNERTDGTAPRESLPETSQPLLGTGDDSSSKDQEEVPWHVQMQHKAQALTQGVDQLTNEFMDKLVVKNQGGAVALGGGSSTSTRK
ncbi:MAG: hypothetical protein MHM6MM_009363 [Cercozoa sp. M6MM]